MNLLPFLKPAFNIIDKFIVDKDERAAAKDDSIEAYSRRPKQLIMEF